MKKTIILLAAIVSLVSCTKALDLKSVRLTSTTKKTTTRQSSTTSKPSTVIPNYKGWGSVLTRSNIPVSEDCEYQQECIGTEE